MNLRKRGNRRIVKKAPTAKIDLPIKDNMDNYQIVMVICFFWAALQSVILFQSLELSLLGFFKFYCLFLGISFLIPISLYRKRLTMSFYEYLIFNIISIAPAFLAILFMLNTLFDSDVYKEEHRIVGTEHTKMSSTYILANGAYNDAKHLRHIRGRDEVEIYGSEVFVIYFTDGLFGLRIVQKREIR